MKIVFHGLRALAFSRGFERFLASPAEITVLPDDLSTSEQQTYASADVVVGVAYNETLPRFGNLKLFQVPGAGHANVNAGLLPPAAGLCNCFGHELAIAEYVMAALLIDCVPLAEADRDLRRGEWTYALHREEGLRPELSVQTIGILGFGHVGQAVAARAKSFGMRVHVANRSAVHSSDLVDCSFAFAELDEFWASADYLVLCVPLAPETEKIVSAAAFGAMRENAMLINVARGGVVDEHALFDALQERRIRRAVIDTWYVYPTGETPKVLPANLAFEGLDNLVMTPHMSGWSAQTLERRQRLIAANVESCRTGGQLHHIIRPAAKS